MRRHCVLKHGILKEFLAEFLGTFVLVVSTGCSFFMLTLLLLADKKLLYLPWERTYLMSMNHSFVSQLLQRKQKNILPC